MTKRALQGPRHQRRLQHLSARDRGGAAARSARHRGERCRRRIRRVGRGGRRLRCGDGPAALSPRQNSTGSASTTSPTSSDIKQEMTAVRPRRYVFLDELPKNNYGKILKTDLRRRLAQERN